MKNRNKYFLIIICVIVFLLAFFIPLNFLSVKLGYSKLTLQDNWISFERKEENNILDKYENIVNSLENRIENTLINYFPFYYSLTSFKAKIEYNANKLISDDVAIMKKNNEYYYYDSLNDFYYSSFVFKEEEFLDRVNKQAAFFNDIAEDIDTYLYLIPTITLTDLKENNNKEYMDLFLEKLSNIQYDYLKYDSIEEYKDYFYATDHHWKGTGALKGYYDIMALLDEEPINDLKIKVYDDIDFYGSKAKMALSTNTADHIEDIDIQLNYVVNINDDSFKPRELVKETEDIYKDYYIEYYDGQYTEVIYEYGNEDKENLLIICDSFVWPIDYLIAANFNKTYVYNFRYTNDVLNIREYIKENNISKVLFLYDANSMAFDGDDYGYQERIK